MFSRRRAASQPPVNTNPTPSAATAAAQAFLSKQRSDASLSAAAAAAALRSHATSPVPVGSVQTKRMVRRGSDASHASNVPAMARQNSVGSMTGRTFRSPTPDMIGRTFRSPTPDMSGRTFRSPTPDMTGRTFRSSTPDSSRATYLRYRNASPTPAVPTIPPVPMKSHKRASSLEPAPPRVSSPTPKKGSRPMSADRAVQPVGARPTAARPTGLSQVTEAPVLEQDPARTEPKPKPTPAKPASSIQQPTQAVTDQPVKRKKKKVVQGTEGSQLTNGSTSPEAVATPVQSGQGTRMPYATSPPPVGSGALPDGATAAATAAATMPRKKKKATVSGTVGQTDPAATASTGPSSPTTMSPVQGGASTIKAKAPGQPAKQQSTLLNNSKLVDSPLAVQGAHTSSQLAAPGSKSPVRSTSQPPTYLSYGPNTLVDGGLVAGASRAVRKERHQSVSPVRSAHFSAMPVILDGKGATKHSPPPRALSPAKSALKHSPSSSVRSVSPVGNVVAAPTKRIPSDTSETPSLGPENGSQAKKKKQARVSFEDDRPASPSAESTTAKRALVSQGRSVDADESDEVMKPTPALPSFGSVRRSKGKQDVDTGAATSSPINTTVPNPAQQPPSSSFQKQATPAPAEQAKPAAPLELSSDHAIGGILSQDLASRARSAASGEDTEDTPIQVKAATVVGAHIDDSSSPPQGSGSGQLATTARSFNDMDHQRETAQVPSISVLPATPGLDERHQELLSGSSPEHTARPPSVEEQPSAVGEVASDGVTAPSTGTEVLGAAQHDSLPTDPVHHDDASSTYSQHEEAANDENSLYSDAEENVPTDHEGGFASLDAILESPMTPGAHEETVPLAPDSPSMVFASAQQRLSNWLPPQDLQPSSAAKVTDWEATRAYWSSLSEQRKQQIEQEALTSGGKSPKSQPEASPVAIEQKPKKKKRIVSLDSASVSTAGQPSISSKAQKSDPQAPVKPAAMRQSMRGASAGSIQSTNMPKTLRHTGTMQASAPQVNKPVQAYSAPPAPGKPRSTQQKPRLPPVSTGGLPSGSRSMPSSPAAPSPATGLTTSKPRSKKPTSRALSNDSDSSASESSFRRKRRATTGADGQYTMRRSMRGTAQAPPSMPDARPTSPTPVSGRKSSRFSIRSLSPTGSYMRNPMGERGRGSVDMSERSLRTKDPKSAKAPARFPGFGKTAKAGPKPSKPASKFSSRFADSSDEEDARPTFRSRFDDSDDEDLVGSPPPTGLTPVRGIPRKPGQASAESTDLSDSEDEQPAQQAVKQPPRTTQPVTSGVPEGSALAAGSLRDANNHVELPNGFPGTKDKKKRGLFGLGRKKDVATEQSPTNGGPVTPLVPSRPAVDRESSFQRSRGMSMLKRTNSKSAAPSSPLNSGRAALPLPPPIPEDTPRKQAERPHTSDGAVMPKTMRRPDVGQRTTTDPNSGKIHAQITSVRTGKKKRFPMLRKVFGLND